MSARSVAVPPELPGLRYTRLLGSGGFSDVYLYEQDLPRRLVAVKVLASDDLSNSSRAAFVAEANLMAQLSAHPYIVTIYNAAVAADGRPYFVMEYCSGPSLAEQYKRAPFGVADALRTGVRVSSAVATAHAAGILHRDIKPANVLTNNYGWPALTDFGISSAVDIELPVNTTTRDAMNAAGTATGTIGMSIPWSPPEMFDDHPQPDVRSDVFSLAATLYTMLVGHTPFEVPGKPNGTVDLIGRIERGTITPITRADVPRSLVSILSKGMAASADDRFATAVDFARALQRVEMELSYAPTAIDVPNLTVLERVHDNETADAADATRIRGVATVHAQPVAPLPPVTAPTTPQGEDPTVIRRMPSVQPHDDAGAAEAPDHTVIRPRPAAPAETPVAVDPLPAGAAPQRRKLWPILVGAAGVVVIGAVVAAGLIFGQPPGDATPTPTASSDIITVGVPTPEAVSVAPNADGTSFTFTWANPEPEDGDRYQWLRTGESDSDSPVSTEAESVTIDGVTSGDKVCIEVTIRRSSGKLSNEPLEMCSE